MEQELECILEQVTSYGRTGKIEELTYMLGTVMQTLITLGCPIDLMPLQMIVDEWANSPDAPKRVPTGTEDGAR